MTRLHNINNVKIPFTAEEEAIADREQAEWEAGAPARAAAAVQRNRRNAYREESDSLFFEELRGEVPEGTHVAKVAEIKNRFPK